jgi:type IV secretion system protein VirB10
MDNDPKELLGITKMKKWPMYVFLASLPFLFAVLYWSIENGNKSNTQAEKKPYAEVQDIKPLVPDDAGKGVVSTPSTPPPAGEKKEMPPIVIVTNNEPPDYKREKDELRKKKHQAILNAFASPLIAKKVSNENFQNNSKQLVTKDNKSTGTRNIDERNKRLERLAGNNLGSQQNDYNPAADKDKENFFERTKASDKQWQASSTRIAGQKFELKTGAVIPAVMISGINSDLPGKIIAQVSQNVFDTATGNYLLIPQGSRLYGVYDSRIIYGQERVLVAWNRIIFPDGSAITLESMPGTDSAGYSGFNDKVNNHYFRVFGSALLMSLITGSTAYAVDTMTPESSLTNSTPSLQQQMTSSLATQLGQTTSQMLTKNMNIKPTLEIRSGYRFNVTVTKDLVFKGPYFEITQNKRY